MTTFFRILISISLFVGLGACSSVTPKKPTEVLTPANVALMRVAPFFPKNAAGVGRIRVKNLLSHTLPLFSEDTSDPEMNALMKARNADFLTTLSSESIAVLGFNILEAEEVVFAISDDGFVAAVLGAKSVSQPSSTVTDTVHVRVVDDMVLIYPKSTSSALIASEGLSVENLEKLTGTEPMLVHVFDFNNLNPEQADNIKTITITGERSGLVRFNAVGKPEFLDIVAPKINEFIAIGKNSALADMPLESPTAQHAIETVFASVVVTRTQPDRLEGKALIPKPLIENASANVGIIAAIALPAFQRYIARAKAMDAELRREENAIQPPSSSPTQSLEQ